MEQEQYDVICIGGGLAGLTSAIHISQQGFRVLVIEKNSYPKHKVCGEYISNEVLPYFRHLGFDPFAYGAQRISRFELSTQNNQRIQSELPLGGFGISRYEIDFQLFTLAKEEGAQFLQDKVVDVEYNNGDFTVMTKRNGLFSTRIVLGSFGKRSNLDVSLNRKFIQQKSPYLAVKTHVRGEFPRDKVALHNFRGGYCGVSKVEDDRINLCYIASFKSFKKWKDIQAFQENVLYQNTALKNIFQNSVPLFEKSLTISQISFKTKHPVENHIIMCGDAAGMIHPLCGNGMGMAIRGAKIASDLIVDYLRENIGSRDHLEKSYANSWNRTFASRLRTGHVIAYLMRKEWLAPKLLLLLKAMPFLVPSIINKTHGKPMKIQ